MTAIDLSLRARQLLKVLVECYIQEGGPVGSKTLAACSGVRVSSATVRNVMSELEALGLVSSPHTSAGRIPTVDAFRFFVDHLLDPVPIDSQWQAKVRQCFSDCRTDRELVRTVAQVLSELTQLAGLVTLQGCSTVQIRKIEFLPQSEQKVLVILVTADAEVSHALISLHVPVSIKKIQAAERWASAEWVDHPMMEVVELAKRVTIAGKGFSEDKKTEPASNDEGNNLEEPGVDALAAQLVLECLSIAGQADDCVVTGQANLLSCVDQQDLVHLEQLYRVLEDRKGILPPIDADGQDFVRVLMGEQATQLGSNFSVITSGYSDSQALRGRLALVGPLRMQYAQLIPFVGWVAKILGAALNEAE